ARPAGGVGIQAFGTADGGDDARGHRRSGGGGIALLAGGREQDAATGGEQENAEDSDPEANGAAPRWAHRRAFVALGRARPARRNDSRSGEPSKPNAWRSDLAR